MDLKIKSIIKISSDSAFSITGNDLRIKHSDSDPSFPDETDIIYALNGTFYINQKSEIGVRFFKTDFEDGLGDGKEIDLYVDQFFTEKFSVRLNLNKSVGSTASA